MVDSRAVAANREIAKSKNVSANSASAKSKVANRAAKNAAEANKEISKPDDKPWASA